MTVCPDLYCGAAFEQTCQSRLLARAKLKTDIQYKNRYLQNRQQLAHESPYQSTDPDLGSPYPLVPLGTRFLCDWCCCHSQVGGALDGLAPEIGGVCAGIGDVQVDLGADRPTICPVQPIHCESCYYLEIFAQPVVHRSKRTRTQPLGCLVNLCHALHGRLSVDHRFVCQR